MAYTSLLFYQYTYVYTQNCYPHDTNQKKNRTFQTVKIAPCLESANISICERYRFSPPPPPENNKRLLRKFYRFPQLLKIKMKLQAISNHHGID